MKKVCAQLTLALLMGIPAWAQYEYPRAVGSLGYSFASLDGLTERQSAHGFQLGGAFNFHKNIRNRRGLRRAVSQRGTHGAGPGGVPVPGRAALLCARLSDHPVRPCARWQDDRRGGIGQRDWVCMGVGGGLDIDAGNRFAVRLFQFDYIPRRFDDQWKHNIRVGVGMVIK